MSAEKETKVVLGRRFTNAGHEHWLCHTKHGLLTLWRVGDEWRVSLSVTRGFTAYEVERASGKTESDAVLSLQSKLRMMSTLDPVDDPQGDIKKINRRVSLSVGVIAHYEDETIATVRVEANGTVALYSEFNIREEDRQPIIDAAVKILLKWKGDK